MTETGTKDKALVIFQPSGRRGTFEVGTPVLDAARSLGVYIESVCGGRGICGRCQVSVSEGQFAKYNITSSAENLSQFSEKEKRYASKRDLADDRRLSCSAFVTGDLVIDVPDEGQVNRQMVRKAADTRHIDRDPATQLCYVEVEEPDMENPLSDADRLIEAIKTEWGYENLTIDFPIYKSLQTILRKGDWKVTAAVFEDKGHPIVTGLWSGFHDRLYGLAVDIGSTTIAMHLNDMLTGQVVASAGVSNPQIRFGEDLMSRVSYIQMNPDKQPELTKAVRDAIDTMIGQVTEEAGVDREEIVEGVFVGNPVMHHLFLGVDPVELGGAPFALTVSEGMTNLARDMDIRINPCGRIYTLPCIAGHVGADAAAVALTEGPHRGEETTLVVDVGTNAEIIIGNNKRALAASSPTGPAFEGAEISCGQRAAPGAIERVRINPETLEPRFKVIGVDLWSDEEGFIEAAGEIGVTGICGSGIVEVIAEMYLAGVISEDGVVDGSLQAKSDRIIANGRTFSYVLWSHGDTVISIIQTDVRAIQLAKAALYAGVKLLMDKLGIETPDAIKFAGAFGSFIDPKYAMVLGLIPDCPLDKVKGVGNSAGTGARMALLNRGHRREIEKTVREIEKIETALEKKFQDHFVNAMAFPNKVDPFTNLRADVTLPEKKAPAEPGDDEASGGRRGGRRRSRRG
ncbi:ASKHA domain-containing protein [Coralliovum pocilloporae]|uniref:ASKHA domain-containing protein n=1 Tax=Coralliovum pocilloporae TaxID=3066369 RepID=UPI00330713CF